MYHIYPILVKECGALFKSLAEKDIWCGVHYPISMHPRDAYKFLRYTNGSFPVAEKCTDELVSVPTFPELTESQIEKLGYEIKCLKQSRTLAANGKRWVFGQPQELA